MDINIGNGLIADYVGFQLTNHGWNDHNEILTSIEDKSDFKVNELKFHLDWDWLNKVVEKCLKSTKVKKVDKDEIKLALLNYDAHDRKHLVWVACIHAIQHRYNEPKEISHSELENNFSDFLSSSQTFAQNILRELRQTEGVSTRETLEIAVQSYESKLNVINTKFEVFKENAKRMYK